MRAGVGLSREPSSAAAGHEAAAAALADVAGLPPALVVVFASHTHDLPALAAAVSATAQAALGKASLGNESVGTVPVVGITGCGIVVDGQFVGAAPHVGVFVLAGSEMEFGVALVEGVRADPADAGRRVARAARASLPAQPPGSIPQQGARSTILLLTDGLAGDQQEIVRGVHAVAGARVPVVGGSAADGYSLTGPSVLFGESSHRDAAVAVWIRSGRAVSIGARHGWRPTGLPAIVTAAEGNRVLQIGGRPARDHYVQRLGLADDPNMAAKLPEWAMRNPLGLLQSNGSHLIRSLLGADGDALVMSATVPTGSSVQVMSGDADSLLDGVTLLGDDLRAGNPDAAGLLVFSCAARRLVLGDLVRNEAENVVTSGLPVLGVYTYGEFCRDSSAQGFHNATVTGVAL